ncbi:hypothetical protein [Acanthopleuribacter pedis]|uniref:DUF3857 domain-containing protein n=1 Tax=Acanthopleuribacter pedis TaxID=442870 RepID=A0A8J7Q7A3_9BACT|nr:hypothetical protein [Acanthopleuribacter pedis]MBO1319621.1 hypothetical protein [Acanthopleuribacter pedis]
MERSIAFTMKRTSVFDSSTNAERIDVWRIRVGDAAVSRFGHVPFDEGGETLEVTVTDGAGNKRTYQPPAQPARDDLGADWYGFDNSQVAVIEGLSDGCLLEIRKVRRWSAERSFRALFLLQDVVPIQKLSVQVTVPKSIALHFDGEPFDERTKGERRLFSYERESVPALAWEPFAAPLPQRVKQTRMIHIGRADQREKRADLMDLQVQFRLHTDVVNSFRPTNSMGLLRLSRRLTRGEATPLAKLQALYRYVTLDIQDRGVRNQMFETTEQAIAGGYAHPLQKTAILQSLAAGIGLEAEVMLVRTRERGTHARPVFVIDEYMPCLRFELDGQLYYAAPYWKQPRLEMLPEALAGADTLHRQADGRVVAGRLPFNPSASPAVEEKLHIRQTGDGRVEVLHKLELAGDEAADWQRLWRESTPAAYRREIAARFGVGKRGFLLGEVSVAQEGRSLTVQYHAAPASVVGQSWDVYALEDWFLSRVGPPAPVAARQTAFHESAPIRVKQALEIHFTANTRLLSAAGRKAFDNDFATVTAEIVPKKDGLSYRLESLAKHPALPADSAPAYQAWAEFFTREAPRRIVLAREEQ